MSQCKCMELDDSTPRKQVWCPIHKDQPLTIPEHWCHATLAVHVYEHPWIRKWHASLSRNAIQIQETELFDTQQEAIAAIKLTP